MSQYSEQILTDICNMDINPDQQIMEIRLVDFSKALDEEDWDDPEELERLANNLQKIKSLVLAHRRKGMRRSKE